MLYYIILYYIILYYIILYYTRGRWTRELRRRKCRHLSADCGTKNVAKRKAYSVLQSRIPLARLRGARLGMEASDSQRGP